LPVVAEGDPDLKQLAGPLEIPLTSFASAL
jgi:hypothetical protein